MSEDLLFKDQNKDSSTPEQEQILTGQEYYDELAINEQEEFDNAFERIRQKEELAKAQEERIAKIARKQKFVNTIAAIATVAATASFGNAEAVKEEPKAIEGMVRADASVKPAQDILSSPNIYPSVEANMAAVDLGVTSEITDQIEGQKIDQATEVLEQSYINDPTRELLPIFSEQVSRYSELIYQAADKYDLDPNIIALTIQQESGGDPNAESPVGALGLMQLMPEYHIQRTNIPEDASWEDMSIAISGGESKYPLATYLDNILDPEQNIDAGTAFLRELIDRTLENNPTIDQISAKSLVAAAIGYNYRPNLVDQAEEVIAESDQLNSETSGYATNMVEQIINIAVAERLKENGATDQQIRDAITG